MTDGRMNGWRDGRKWRRRWLHAAFRHRRNIFHTSPPLFSSLMAKAEEASGRFCGPASSTRRPWQLWAQFVQRPRAACMNRPTPHTTGLFSAADRCCRGVAGSLGRWVGDAVVALRRTELFSKGIEAWRGVVVRGELVILPAHGMNDSSRRGILSAKRRGGEERKWSDLSSNRTGREPRKKTGRTIQKPPPALLAARLASRRTFSASMSTTEA